MEGIAFEVADCIEVLEVAGGSVERSRLTGGGFAQPFACQLMADVTGRPAHRAGERHAALAGAMLLAGQWLGRWSNARAEAVARLRDDQVYAPDPAGPAIYLAAATRYRAAADAVLGLSPS
jgi:xylulokinase